MIAYILFPILLSSVLSAPLPTERYANELVLVEPDVYYLYWNYTESEILFELHVKNEGWNAFGISPTGGMPNSDFIVTWVNNDGSTHFTDRHITEDLNVVVDKEQDWIPLLVKKKDGYTISKFTRKIKRCDDSNEDLDIPDGTPFIIFSWGTNFANGDITYHGRNNRGSKIVPLISSLNLRVDLDETKLEIEEFRVNTTIENIDTFYYCQMFKIPTSWANKKRHLLRYETLFTKGNDKYLHHWLFNECPMEFATDYVDKYGLPESGPCFSYQTSQPEISAQWIKVMNLCRKVSLGWAVGGDIVQDFPSNIAYPMGGPDADFQYFFLQIHYDNPQLIKDVKDYSGVKLYLSQEYRPIEFGVLTVGTVSDFTGLIIPPNAEKFTADYACRKECTNHLFEKVPEVNVFTTLPHTHLIGKEVYSKIIREGKEIGYITNNRYYDFNYQYYNFLTKPFTLQMGDEISTTCVYKSKNKKEFVQGGHSTAEEMW